MQRGDMGNELSEGRRAAEWGEQRGRDVVREDLLGIFRSVDEGGGRTDVGGDMQA